ncbi:MAG: Ig-like domain-containing protein [Gemmatimonadetes bacterium]|nr:Ig-like domain-containing protein [Gemmatimonadota bacterium]
MPSHRSSWRLLLLMVFLMLGSGTTISCSSSTDPDSGPVAASVEVSAAVQLLRSIGEQTTVIAQVRDASGATISKPVIWTSSDAGVVMVSGDGTVTATGNGEADIVARVDQAADTVRITVAQVAASLSLSGPDTLFNPGVPARYTARLARYAECEPIPRSPSGEECRAEDDAGVDHDGPVPTQS